jgi:hypothetical protein
MLLRKIFGVALFMVVFSCFTFANLTITDVTDYGATPNDLSNDTFAIQAALNQTGAIYFPKGFYIIRKTGGFFHTQPFILRSRKKPFHQK